MKNTCFCLDNILLSHLPMWTELNGLNVLLCSLPFILSHLKICHLVFQIWVKVVCYPLVTVFLRTEKSLKCVLAAWTWTFLLYASPSAAATPFSWFMHTCMHVYMPCCTAYRILVPQPGIELVPLVVKLQSPNHWTTREFPRFHDFNASQVAIVILPYKF